MKVIRCDRCLKTGGITASYSSGSYEFDLCIKCNDELQQWINEEVKKQE